MLFDKFIASSRQYDKNADLEVKPVSLQTAKTKIRFAALLYLHCIKNMNRTQYLFVQILLNCLYS